MVEVVKEHSSVKLFSIVKNVLLWLAILIFVSHACTHMVAAGDTWVAMACGRHFVNHGVDVVEPFSYNSHKPGPTDEELSKFPKWSHNIVRKIHPTGWINQNWLTHVIFYKLTTLFGSTDSPNFDMLVYWKFAIYLIVAVSIYFSARLIRASSLTSATMCCVAMYISRSFLDIRPAGFSNLLVPVFLFVIALTVYKNYRYIWLIVPIAIFWANVHGGYLYMFVALFFFLAINFSARFIKWDKLIYVDTKALVHVFLASATAFIAMIVFNPYHLTNLTHTFIISASKHAEEWRKVNEWHSSIEITNPVGKSMPFIWLIFSLLGILALWALCHTFSFRELAREKSSKKLGTLPHRYIDIKTIGRLILTLLMIVLFNVMLVDQANEIYSMNKEVISKISEVWFLSFGFMGVVSVLALFGALKSVKAAGKDGYLWPKIDLFYLVISAFTISMAIKSRRFIPIAAFASAPFAALMIDQIWQMLSSRINFQIKKDLAPIKFPIVFPVTVAILTLAVITIFGGYSVVRFKQVYLDPWPSDAKRNSIFMRMTASNLKPFDACRFMRENNLSGHMLNYWTEGGFVAFGQTPIPETGHIPLKLFMDGRAQAAYDIEVFHEYNYGILAGGPVGLRVKNESIRKQRSRKCTIEEKQQIAKYLKEKFDKYDIWIVLMPKAVFRDPMLQTLESLPNWKTVFLNDIQKIMIDVNSEQGLKLWQNVISGKAEYPNEYDQLLIDGIISAGYKNDHAAAFDQFKRSYEQGGNLIALNYIIGLNKIGVKNAKNNFFESLLNDFLISSKDYEEQDGFEKKIYSAMIAANYLKNHAANQSDKERYTDIYKALKNKQKEVMKDIVW